MLHVKFPNLRVLHTPWVIDSHFPCLEHIYLNITLESEYQKALVLLKSTTKLKCLHLTLYQRHSSYPDHMEDCAEKCLATLFELCPYITSLSVNGMVYEKGVSRFSKLPLQHYTYFSIEPVAISKLQAFTGLKSLEVDLWKDENKDGISMGRLEHLTLVFESPRRGESATKTDESRTPLVELGMERQLLARLYAVRPKAYKCTAKLYFLNRTLRFHPMKHKSKI